MAAVPPIRKLAPEQLPGEHRPWVERAILEPLNRFLVAVADALNGQLTLRNFLAETISVKVTVPSGFTPDTEDDGTPIPASCFPLTFNTRFAAPLKVECVQARATDNSLHSGVTFQWENATQDKRPAVVVRNATGLVAGKTYNLTFVVYGSD